MATKTVTFNDFSGGEEGLGRPAPNKMNTFRGVNVWRYPAGIGPRPAFTLAPTSGAALNSRDVILMKDSSGPIVLTYDNSTVQMYTPSTGIVTNLPAHTNKPMDCLRLGTRIIYVSPLGSGSYFTGTTITNVAAIPTAVRIEKFGRRTVIVPQANQIRWSAYDDPLTWPAANVASATDGETILDLWEQRGNLLILDTLGQIQVMQGSIGTNETLRRQDIGPSYAGAARYTGATGYVRPYIPAGGVVNGSNAWWRSDALIARFDGSQVDTRSGLTTPNVLPTVTAFDNAYFVSLRDDDEFVWILSSTVGPQSTAQLVWHHADGAFTMHNISQIPTAGPVTATPGLTDYPPVLLGDYTPTNGFYLVSNGSTSAARQPTLLRSTYTDTDYASFPTASLNDGYSGAPVSATFRSPEVWADSGNEIMVKSIIIDYSYRQGDTIGSLAQCRVGFEISQLANDTQKFVPSSTQTIIPPNDAGTDFADFNLIERERKVFEFGDSGVSCGAFRVLIDNWKGILVHQFTVVYDETPFRG